VQDKKKTTSVHLKRIRRLSFGLTFLCILLFVISALKVVDVCTSSDLRVCGPGGCITIELNHIQKTIVIFCNIAILCFFAFGIISLWKLLSSYEKKRFLDESNAKYMSNIGLSLIVYSALSFIYPLAAGLIFDFEVLPFSLGILLAIMGEALREFNESKQKEQGLAV